MAEFVQESSRRSLFNWLTKIPITTGLITLFMLYLSHTLWSVYQIYNPKPCPMTDNCLQPSWKSNTKFHISAFVSTSRAHHSGNLKSIWTAENFDIMNSSTIDINVSLPRKTMNNGSLFLHLLLTDADQGDVRHSLASLSHFYPSLTASKSTALTKYVIPKSKAFNLLESQDNPSEIKKNPKHITKPETHWIQRLSVHIMSEPLPVSSIPQEMHQYFQITNRRQYLPMLYLDHFGLLEKDFYPVNSSSAKMPLTIAFIPVTFGKMRLIASVDYSLKMIEKAGFSEKDTDDVKAIFFDTNIYLLCVTFIVSAFHLLFDLLSFKNDISFWRKKQSNVGISFRSLIWRCISQTIVFLYLYDQGTSLLVLVPAGISIIIELWKVSKTLKLKLVRRGLWFAIELGTISDEERESDTYDSEGMKYLFWIAGPCCLVFASYSLLYVQHTSWYSWCIESVVNGVYAFGFVFMLPQLFVNYKLKSVSHLPWRAFMYKAFNTVVDDLFAFIITMPTAHRVACFRDDIVFIIYLYQRWLYPVDSSRQTEYSDSYDSKSEKKKTD